MTLTLTLSSSDDPNPNPNPSDDPSLYRLLPPESCFCVLLLTSRYHGDSGLHHSTKLRQASVIGCRLRSHDGAPPVRTLTHVYGRLRPVRPPPPVLRPAAQPEGGGVQDQGHPEGGARLLGGPPGQERVLPEEGEGDGGGPSAGLAGDPRPEGLVLLLHIVGEVWAGHRL